MPDVWYGESLGPAAMQGLAETPPKETPMMARMGTPDGEWEELLNSAIKGWTNHVIRTGRKAPEES